MTSRRYEYNNLSQKISMLQFDKVLMEDPRLQQVVPDTYEIIYPIAEIIAISLGERE